MKYATWETLQVFAVTSATGSTDIFANGRQQTRLRIKVQAIDINGTPVPLSDEELASLQLIEPNGRPVKLDPLDYHERALNPLTFVRKQYDPEEYERVASGSVVFNPAKHDLLQYNKARKLFNDVTTVWSGVRNTDYEFYPRASAERLPEEDYGSDREHIYVVDVYVRTISDIQVRLAVRLTRDDGQTFDSLAYHNGRLTLRPVVPPTYVARDYDFKRIAISGDVESKQHFDTLDYYTFDLVSNNIALEFRHFEMKPLSIRRDAVAPMDRGSITGFTYPGDDHFNYGMALKQLPTRLNPGYKRPGKVFINLVRRHKFESASAPIVSPGNSLSSLISSVLAALASKTVGVRPVMGPANPDPVVSAGPATIRALDMYGNDHVVRLQFRGNGRNYLELV
ncbi:MULTISPECIES: hypothetical protein [unclassified Pseudomonas]|uniref:hypothetical protein n=1 Tax=unclassified Pseudomonas TaxID=196821 RepID=UPI0025F4B7DF|nr:MULTISPECIES: hypothetical protein [unclassified Pseudomonas]